MFLFMGILYSTVMAELDLYQNHVESTAKFYILFKNLSTNSCVFHLRAFHVVDNTLVYTMQQQAKFTLV